VVCQSPSLSVTRLRCAKTAERIDVLFGTDTPGDPRHTVLDGSLVTRYGEERGKFETAFAELLLRWVLL